MVAAQHPLSPKEKSKRRALLFLAIVPALLLIAAIKQYAVNVPFGDEWQMIPLFAKWHAHELTFHDLYEQHNEHRILFPKLVFLAFAALTHWNLRAEMFFSVALVAATSAAIYILIRRTLPDSPRRVALLWVLANLLLFSPSQGENWLWGFQLQVFIPNLCLVAALVAITSVWNSYARIAVGGFFAVVASFSFGNGLLLWPLLALCLLLRREKKMLILIWLAMFVIVYVCYFAGYRRHVPPPGHWMEYICYFSAFLGGVLARQREGALLMSPIIIGMAASFLYAAFAVRFLKQRGPDFAKTVPWLIIGAYPLGSAVIAAAARIDSGMGQAVDSRYITISSLLYLSLVMLSVLAARGPDSRETTSSRWLAHTASPIATCVIVLTLTAMPWGLRYMRNLQRERIAGLGALQFAKVIDVTSALHRHLVNSQTPISLLESVRILDQLQLLHHPLRESARIQEKAGVPLDEAQEFGATDNFQQRDEQTFEVSGWAFLPDDGMAGPCVVLAYRLGEEWFGFALSDTRQSRPDIAHSKHDARYTESGWRKTFRRDALPAEADHISAWTVDPLSGEVHKLPGSCPLPKS